MDVIEIDPRLQDHALGVELQIVDLVEKRDRARVEGWPEEEARLQAQIDALYEELASTAERLAQTAAPSEATPRVHAGRPHAAA